ncbi:MAG: hypothetical protein MJ105_03890 [Lachnospiraceae bacterium]|nr:hypothetical protein [Lachnospiraceae bacterium]
MSEEAKKKPELTEAEKAKYNTISKVLIIIGAIFTAIAPFLTLFKPTLNGESMYETETKMITYTLKKGFALSIGENIVTWLYIIPLVLAAVLIILALLKKDTFRYIAGVLGLAGGATMVIITMTAMKVALSAWTAYAALSGILATADCSFGIGYYLLVVGYLLVIGGAVATKGLDSISSPDEEEEAEEAKEEASDDKEEKATSDEAEEATSDAEENKDSDDSEKKDDSDGTDAKEDKE